MDLLKISMAGILLEDDFQLENHHTLQISLRLRGGKIFIIYLPKKDITIKFEGSQGSTIRDIKTKIEVKIIIIYVFLFNFYYRIHPLMDKKIIICSKLILFLIVVETKDLLKR